MLTEQQLTNLEPLTKDETYGALLSDAIINWKKENINPCQMDFGVTKDLFSNDYSVDNNSACLLGASIIGKEMWNKYPLATYGIFETIKSKFNISWTEARRLHQGFDNIILFCNVSDIKAYEFGRKVKEALWPTSQ